MDNNQNQALGGSLNGENRAQNIPAAKEHGENVIAGIVGALLFSLIGGALYFVIYQIGFIAGITGLVIFVLANFGYGLFSGRKNSITGIVVSIICLILTTLLAEYMCIAYAIYDTYREYYNISFFTAIRSAFNFIIDPEINLLGDVVSDVLFALVFGAISAFGTIRTAIRAGKAPTAPAVNDKAEETESTVATDAYSTPESSKEEDNAAIEE